MRHTARWIGVITLSCGAGLALAQAEDEPRAEPSDPLAGPEVVSSAPPGMEKTFGMAMRYSPMIVRDSVGMSPYLKMVRGLEGDAALTEAQLAEVKEIEQAWTRLVWTYWASRLDEIEAVHEKLPEGEAKRMAYMLRGGTRAMDNGWTTEVPAIEIEHVAGGSMVDSMASAMSGSIQGTMADSMTGSMTGSMAGSMAGSESEAAGNASVGVTLVNVADARAKLRQIQRGTPRPWESQSAVWRVLSAEQRDALERELIELRMQQRHAREQREMRRAAQRTGGEIAPTLLEHVTLLRAAERTGKLSAFSYGQLSDERRAELDAMAFDDRVEAVRALAADLASQLTFDRSLVATPQATDGGKPAADLAALEFAAEDTEKSERNNPSDG